MTVWGLGLYMNFKQAVGSENIYGVFNVFVKAHLDILSLHIPYEKISTCTVEQLPISLPSDSLFSPQ